MASKLTARKVETAKPGKYSDGGNLYLIVSESGARKWVLRFTWRGRAKEMGLGSAASVPLADAREKAASARRKIAQGLNPIDERKRDGGIPTFGEMADDVREALSAGFRNEKHKAQWKSTLETYAAPLRAKPVDTIATDDVLAVLKPIWTTKAETASRVRGRIEKVLDAAKAKGFRDGENPARWRGHLDHLLPRPSKLARGHHAAMPYEEVAAFIAKLRRTGGDLGAGAGTLHPDRRTIRRNLGNALAGNRLRQKVWTVPADRMKAGREHRVPLSARAIAILRQLEKLKTGDFIFAGQARNKPLSNMAMEMVLRRMKIEVCDRSRLSVQLSGLGRQLSNFPREIIETALAHVIGDKAEQAYRRSDALEKRRKLMEAWAVYCGTIKAGKVVAFRRNKSGA